MRQLRTAGLILVLIAQGLFGPRVALAQSGVAEAAQDASNQLAAAMTALDQAQTARDRVKALTKTVHGFESGLEALRDGLRRATIEERRVALALQAQEADVARLLGVLQSLGDGQTPTLLLHPQGALGTARAGMLLADVTPALQARVDALRAQLDDRVALRQIRQTLADRLAEGLAAAQQARVALSQSIADRVDLPRRFLEDPDKTAALIAAADSLAVFADAVSDIATQEAPGSLPDIAHRKGALTWPVQGILLRQSGQADAAGIVRPGLVLATLPQALVTTPVAATIRYAGPLLDYGQVVILEPQADLLIVLAGLGTSFGRTGEVVPSGAPVGLMGGQGIPDGAILSQAREGAGPERSETLYIEIREGSTPVEPLTWFDPNKG